MPVLVVEDDRIVREAILLFLRDRGIDARGAESCFDARRKIALYRPKVLITDLNMKEEYGGELLEEKLVPHEKTIVLSAGSLSDGINDAYPEVLVMRKPIEPDHLLLEVLRRLRQ